MKLLTFDLEDWFHLLETDLSEKISSWHKHESRFEASVEKILELLQARKVKATFFALGWIAERYPAVIKKISNLGYEVGSHSYAHQLVYRQSNIQFRNDLLKSIDIISDITGCGVTSYRAPGFSINMSCPWFFEELARAGVLYDFSVFPANRSHGGGLSVGNRLPFLIETREGLIKEFPMTYYNLFSIKLVYSGGGYFRLMPAFAIEKILSRQKYVMTYFHPRDFDPDQPMVQGLSLIRKFKSYIGLAGAYKKLDDILSTSYFLDALEFSEIYDWESSVRISDLKIFKS